MESESKIFGETSIWSQNFEIKPSYGKGLKSHFIYLYQILSTQELPTLQDMQERKKKTCYMISFYFIYKKLPTQNGKKILHNGEYQ